MYTKHVLIKGRVQGVFYRATAKEVAERVGVVGWIKNTATGDVEAMITGSELQLQAFIDWCHVGPKAAVVNDVLVSDVAFTFFPQFTILRG